MTLKKFRDLLAQQRAELEQHGSQYWDEQQRSHIEHGRKMLMRDVLELLDREIEKDRQAASRRWWKRHHRSSDAFSQSSTRKRSTS
jgi:hypothetical protein